MNGEFKSWKCECDLQRAPSHHKYQLHSRPEAQTLVSRELSVQNDMCAVATLVCGHNAAPLHFCFCCFFSTSVPHYLPGEIKLFTEEFLQFAFVLFYDEWWIHDRMP